MNKQPTSGHQHSEMHGGDVKDPVCGMQVTPDSAFGKLDHGGKTYFFCSAHCQNKFAADPNKFAAGSGQ